MISPSESEVTALWTSWCRTKDPEIRAELARHYLPLVDRLARKIGSSIHPSHRQDVHGFGVLGLLDAIDKFRPELGFSFTTYGSVRITGAMRDGLRTLSWFPRASRRRRNPGSMDSVVVVDFQSGLGDRGVPLKDYVTDGDDGPEEIAAIADDYKEMKRAVAHLPSLERKVVMEIYYGNRRLKEIAGDLDVTESRVCQIHRRALRMLESRFLQRQSA
jgi:RNA polymerase sigma factor for flagellar operon FliA